MKEMISSLQLRSYPLDRKRNFDGEASGVPKRRRTIRNIGDGKFAESDAYCWICHCDGTGVCCELCPRLYHIKCLSQNPASVTTWVCPECQKIMMAEALETRPISMQSISLDTLCVLLKYVLQRMKLPETKPFHQPVDCGAVPSYTDYVFHPMDFATIDKNIKKKAYGSPEAFVADFKWILHNCVVFNGKNHALTSVAKTIVKMCCHEINELLICPDCYLNSCIKDSDDWFCEPCRTPHTLVWAKMKGYPFWPAKVLREDNNGQVDVRFFGEHDRAWVPLNQVFMLSLNPPSLVPKKTKGFDGAKIELDRHVQLLREKNSDFKYADDKVPYESKRAIIIGAKGMHGNILDEVSCSSSSDIQSSSLSYQPGLITPEATKARDSIKKRKSNKMQLKKRISTRHYNVIKKQIRSEDNVVAVDNQMENSCTNSINPLASDDQNKYEKIVLKINKMHILPQKTGDEKASNEQCFECNDSEVNSKNADEVNKHNDSINKLPLLSDTTSDAVFDETSINESSFIHSTFREEHSLLSPNANNEKLEIFENLKRNVARVSNIIDQPKVSNDCIIVEDNPETSVKSVINLNKTNIDITKYQNKFLANVQELVTDIVNDIRKNSPNTFKDILSEEIQQFKKFYSSELEALNHTKSLQIAEMRLLYDFDKIKMNMDKNEEISCIKLKRWCSSCLSEATLNCCSATDYCSYLCQQKHWNVHKNFCTQSINQSIK